MATGSRREREKEQHRHQVLEAAEAVFAEKGFHNATVQEIAARAEFAVGTIYNMFESKTVIYGELVEMRAQQYIERAQHAMEQAADPVEKIRALIAAKLGFFDANQRFFQIFTRATSGGQEQLPFGPSENTRRMLGEYMEQVSGVFAEGIRSGAFAEADPRLLTLIVEGMTNAVIAHSIHTGGQKLDAATPENIQRVVFCGLLPRREG